MTVVQQERVVKLRTTMSICPECNRVIHAKIFVRGDKVYIGKECPEHGYFEDLYFGSYYLYKKFARYARDGRGVLNPKFRAETINCPMGCGLCSNHLSHTALANIVVTNRCDLNCWYCFFYAEKAGYVYEPTIEEIRKMVRNLRSLKPIRGNAIQLTGGEPTVREDLVEIIRAIKEEGIDHVQLNTDGINLALKPDLCRRIREAGVNTVYLSFDGVTPKTNPKNYWEIPKAIENCRRAKLGIVLVPTVIKTVNDHELGDMIRFAFYNMDIIRGVNFQPVSLVGRISKAERERYRITIPDAIKRIEEQTDGQITMDDWYPIPAAMPFSHFVESWTNRLTYELSNHFACGAATYVFKEGDKMIPISRFVDIDGLLNFLDEKAEDIENGKSKYIVGLKFLTQLSRFVKKEYLPSGLNLTKLLFNIVVKHNYSALGEFHKRSLFLGMMHFMDKYNHDEERVRRCDIHYLIPDGRIIPFCSFNVLPEIYRDVIQRKYSISIEEWERRTGRKLKDDYYRRPSFRHERGENLFLRMGLPNR